MAIDPDALSWLSGQLGADRASTRAELEKLALFVGPGNRVDIDAAQTCVGDLAGLSLDDAMFAATAGDVATTDRALELAMAEGANAVQILRTAMGHLQRLHRARLAMDRSNLSAADAATHGASAGISISVSAPSTARLVCGRPRALKRHLRRWRRPNGAVSVPAGLIEPCAAMRS